MKDSRENMFQILENVVFLKKNRLFGSMHTRDLRALSAIAEEMSFDLGATIVREGDVGDSLFIIRSGSVRIEKKDEAGESLLLAHLAANEYFGEMALFDAEVRSASVIAAEACVLLCIRSDDLNDVLMENPSIALEFLKTFAKRIRELNHRAEELTLGAAAGA